MGRKKTTRTPKVRVVGIEWQERNESPLLSSIARKTNERYRYKFVFDVDGELVERTYNRFFGKESTHRADPNDMDFCTIVKVQFRDGSWKYAIQGYRKKTETIGRELVSLYAGKLRNPSTLEWEWPGTLYASEAPDDTVGKMVPLYNENIESAIEEGTLDKKFKNASDVLNYRTLYRYVNPGPRLWMKKWIDTLTMKQKIEVDAENYCEGLGTRMLVQKLRYSRPPRGFERWKDCPPRFYTWYKVEYIKSYYKPRRRTVWKCELYYLDDLLAIYDKYTPSEDGEERMVWNSLDETCHGNI